MFDHTGYDGVVSSWPSSRWAKASAAEATTGLWKAHATGIGRAAMPWSSIVFTAAAIAALGPEITTWSGAL